jgi:hypothetical protein
MSRPSLPGERLRLDDELEWFFGYAESALRRGRLVLLPSHAAGGARARDVRAKANRLALAVQASLVALPNPHAVVLRAVFSPRRWPRPVQESFEQLAPLAVRLFSTLDPWPRRHAHQGLEEAAAVQLAARLQGPESAHVEGLRVQAARLFESARSAYGKQRQLAAPRVPR